jgi:hypothetical protein
VTLVALVVALVVSVVKPVSPCPVVVVVPGWTLDMPGNIDDMSIAKKLAMPKHRFAARCRNLKNSKKHC